MNKNDLAIATISLTRTVEEERTLRRSLASLAALNVPVYVTDGGSSGAFLEFLNSFPQFVVFSEKGLWPQAKNSITKAAQSGAKWILYTEPDKQEFFSTHLPRMIEEATVTEATGVVLASRSTRGFQTFPPFQQMTEATINNCCKEVIGMNFDYCYGPFLFNAKLVSHLAFPPENCGWGWRPFLFALAHRIGLSVTSFEADFECPADQRKDDEKERLYRMKQLTQNIDGLLLATSAPLE